MSILSRNIIYNFLGQGFLIVLGLVSTKYVFKELGGDILGIIYFATTISITLGAVLEKGLSATIAREVSIHSKSQPGYIHDLIRTASTFYWCAFILCGLAIYFLSPIIVEKWIIIKGIDETTAVTILQIMGIASLITLPRSFYASIFRGLERMEFNNLIDVILYGIQQFGTILILLFGGGLFHVVYWLAACFGFSILAYLAISTRFFLVGTLLPGYSLSVIKKNFGFASKMTFNSVTGVVYMSADKAIISNIFPIGIFGYYSFAYGIVSKCGLVTGAVAMSALPTLSTLYNTGNRTDLMKQYRKLHDMLCFVMAPLFVAIFYALPSIFSYIFNEQAAKMLLLPTTLLCIGFYMNVTMTLPYIFSIAIGKPGITGRFHLLALFTSLPLTVVLINMLGLTGAGLSLVSFYLLSYVYALPKFCFECMNIPVSQWIKHIGRIIVLVSLTYGIAWSILWVNNSYSILSLSSAYALATSAYLYGAWHIMGDELRELLLRLFIFVKGALAKWRNLTVSQNF